MAGPLRRSAALWGALGMFGSSVAAAAPTAPQSESAPAVRRITLAEALAYARGHQPAVLASLARIRTEEANAQVPRSQYYPLLGLTAQFLEGTTNNTTAS